MPPRTKQDMRRNWLRRWWHWTRCCMGCGDVSLVPWMHGSVTTCIGHSSRCRTRSDSGAGLSLESRSSMAAFLRRAMLPDWGMRTTIKGYRAEKTGRCRVSGERLQLGQCGDPVCAFVMEGMSAVAALGSSGWFDKRHDGCYSWTRFVRAARAEGSVESPAGCYASKLVLDTFFWFAMCSMGMKMFMVWNRGRFQVVAWGWLHESGPRMAWCHENSEGRWTSRAMQLRCAQNDIAYETTAWVCGSNFPNFLQRSFYEPLLPWEGSNAGEPIRGCVWRETRKELGS